MKHASIKHTLETLIRNNAFLEDGLYHGYINLTSLAVYLCPTVERLSGKKTTIGSLTMTLSRIAATLQKRQYIHIRPEDIRVRTGISYVTFSKAPGLTTRLNDLSAHLDMNSSISGQLFSQLEGSREITVLFTEGFAAAMNEIFATYPPLTVITELVDIVVHIPPEYLEEQGIIYYVVKQLNYFGVNIIELYTTMTELSFLIRKEDLKSALSVLT